MCIVFLSYFYLSCCFYFRMFYHILFCILFIFFFLLLLLGSGPIFGLKVWPRGGHNSRPNDPALESPPRAKRPSSFLPCMAQACCPPRPRPSPLRAAPGSRGTLLPSRATQLLFSFLSRQVVCLWPFLSRVGPSPQAWSASVAHTNWPTLLAILFFPLSLPAWRSPGRRNLLPFSRQVTHIDFHSLLTWRHATAVFIFFLFPRRARPYRLLLGPSPSKAMPCRRPRLVISPTWSLTTSYTFSRQENKACRVGERPFLHAIWLAIKEAIFGWQKGWRVRHLERKKEKKSRKKEREKKGRKKKQKKEEQSFLFGILSHSRRQNKEIEKEIEVIFFSGLSLSFFYFCLFCVNSVKRTWCYLLHVFDI